jgi:hypothetical protein
LFLPRIHPLHFGCSPLCRSGASDFYRLASTRLPRIGAALNVLLLRMPGLVFCVVDLNQSSIPNPVFPDIELFNQAGLKPMYRRVATGPQTLARPPARRFSACRASLRGCLHRATAAPAECKDHE